MTALKYETPMFQKFITRLSDNSYVVSYLIHWLRLCFHVSCRAAYTILLKYAGIATVHILFMIANISVPRATQLPATEHVLLDNVKLRTRLTLMITEIPQCDMIIMSVQSEKYKLKRLLKNHSVSPACLSCFPSYLCKDLISKTVS